MELKATTYSCPHCAEKIQRLAVTCRFCGRGATWNLTLVRKPTPAAFGAAMKELYERFGKSRFQSYGAMRKATDEDGSVLFQSLNREEAETAERIVSAGGGETRIELDPDDFSVPPQPASKRRAATQFLLAAVALLLLAGLYYLKKGSVPPPSAPGTTSPPPVAASPSEKEPQASQKEAAPQISREVQIHLQSLVRATATLSGNGVTGSAFFIHSDGYLISNHHVTERMREIYVQTADGKKRPGRIVRSDTHLDLALVKTEGGPYPTLTLGDATALEQGETVWTIGAPHGLSFTVTRGVVSFVGRNIGGKAFIQADVAINPGNSGGPMINENGEAVGINNFIISNAEGLNFAIPINYIYMGNDCIAKEIIPTSPDNAVIAEWRSWETSSPSAVSQTMGQPPLSREDPSNDELVRLIGESTNLQNRYEQKKRQRQAAIARLQSQLSEQNNRYQAAESISQESARGEQVKALTQQVLREELSLAEETLEYCGRQEALLLQIQNAALNDDQLMAQVNAQLSQFRQLRAAVQNEKNKKTAELQDAQEAMY